MYMSIDAVPYADNSICVRVRQLNAGTSDLYMATDLS